MSGGLEFEVLPENCLRNDHLELVLGTPINQIIAALQNASRFVKNVELVYCNKEPFEREITITLKNDGIRLYFEPKAQILKLIEVFDFKNITLHYCNTVFSSPGDEANVSKVENCFGATHPGVYDEKAKMYLLHWRGVSFSFPAKEPSSTIQPSYAHGLSSLNFVNSSLPLLERMTIFCGASPSEIRTPEVPISVHCGNVYPISVESINEDGKITGLRVTFLSEDDTLSPPRKTSELARADRIIRFGDSEQSVLSSLGAPSKIFYKSDEKMLIQRGSNSENLKNVDQPDFFFNYFTLGLVG
ncbi:PHAF1 protein [Ditylenchus destructor]|uniref:PHAF1 protein n=1 Tax=Ditylenchus destructor TaxID=166010 RepID=A0AAD4NB03_9BILA|nr:PHAF1 protein [Ditylenchus destructor]